MSRVFVLLTALCLILPFSVSLPIEINLTCIYRGREYMNGVSMPSPRCQRCKCVLGVTSCRHAPCRQHSELH